MKDFRREKKIGVRLGLIAFIVILFLFLLIGVNSFFNTYYLKFAFPIELHMPITIHKRTPVVKIEKVYIKASVPVVYAEKLTPKQIIMAEKHRDILWRVYGLESTWGKNDSCKVKGLYNGFGYNPGSCYKTFNEIVIKVNDWFENELQRVTLIQALCLYNTGRILNNCTYAQNYNTL